MTEPIRPILRHMRVLSWQCLRAAEQHGRRIGPSVGHCATVGPRTIAFSKFSPDPYDLVAAVKGLAAAHGAKFREGASVAQEAIFSLSPHAFETDDPAHRFNPDVVRSFIPAAMAYLDANFPNQVAAIRFDFDESSFHGSAFICPVAIQRTNVGIEKCVISVRSRFGSRKMLSELQNIYAKAMAPLGAVAPRRARETGHVHGDFREFHREVNQKAENQKAAQTQFEAEKIAWKQEQARADLAQKAAQATFELDCKVERLRLKEEDDALHHKHARASQTLNADREKLDQEYKALGVAMECIEKHSLVLIDDADGQMFAVQDDALEREKLDLLLSTADQSERFRNMVVALLRCQSGIVKSDGAPPAPLPPSTEIRPSLQPAEPPATPANSNVSLRQSLAMDLAKSVKQGDARFKAAACIHLLAKAARDQKLADEFSGYVEKFLARASDLKLTYAARDFVADLIRLGSASSAERCLREINPDLLMLERFLETMSTHEAPDNDEAPEPLQKINSQT